MSEKKWQLPLLVLLLLYAAFVVVHLSRHPDAFQWDFKTYYFYAKANAAGLNLYDTQILRNIFPCLYQPVALYFYYPFLLLTFSQAYQVLLFLNIIVIIFLFYLWRRWFLINGNVAIFCLFITISFNNTVYRALAAGNISLFEELFIWAALVFFVQRRLILFCLSIVLVATFKIQPILFLGLLFLSEDKKQALTYLGLSLLGYVVIVGASYLRAPHMFFNFLTAAQGVALGEIGDLNPSTLAIILDYLNRFGNVIGFPLSPTIAVGIYLAVVILILLISLKALITLKCMDDIEQKKLALLFACVVYALIVPRFKDYMYILLLAPSFFIILNANFLQVKNLLFIIIIFSPDLTLPLVGGTRIRMLMSYYPLFIAYFVWYLYLRYISLVSSGKHTPLSVP